MKERMKRAALLFAMFFVAAFGTACTPEQIAANEAQAKAVVAQVKAGVGVAVAAAKSAVDAVCENQTTVASAAAVTRAGLMTQTGPNTTQNIKNLDTALGTLNAACAQAAANPNDPAMRSLLLTAWAAYNNVKARTGGAS